MACMVNTLKGFVVLLAFCGWGLLKANDPAIGAEHCRAVVSGHSQAVDPLNPEAEESLDSILIRSKGETSSSKTADQVTYVLSERLSRWINLEVKELTELEATDHDSAELRLRKEALDQARLVLQALERKLAPVLIADVAHWETQDLLLQRAANATGDLLQSTLLKLTSMETSLRMGIERLKKDIAQEVYNPRAKENMQRSLASAEQRHSFLAREIDKLRSRDTAERLRSRLTQQSW